MKKKCSFCIADKPDGAIIWICRKCGKRNVNRFLVLSVFVGIGLLVFFIVKYIHNTDEIPIKLPITSYSGSRENGLPHGNGKARYFFGDNDPQNGVYEGYFRNGLRHGKGKMVFDNGNWYEGDYVDGKAEGFGEFFTKGKNERYIGQWISNVLHGKVSVFSAINGNKLYDATWDMGIEVSGSRVESK